MLRTVLEREEASAAAAALDETRRYSFLADSVPLILWTARPDGGLDYYNKAWFDYTGLTLAETQDWGWGAVIHPDDLDRCIARWKQAFTTGEDYEIEYRFKRGSDGSYRWFLGRASARRDEAGAIVQWVGTGTDINDRKRAEGELRRAHSQLETRVAERTVELAKANEELKGRQTESRRSALALLESKRFLQSTLDALSSHIAILDEHGTIVEVNAAWARFARENHFPLGRSGVGDNYLEVCDSAPRDSCDEASAAARGIRAVMARQIDEFVLEYPCHSPGEERWFTLRVTRFGGEGPLRVVAAHESITARKLAEEELQRKTALLEAQLNSSIDGILVVDEGGRKVLQNQRLIDLFRIPPEVAADNDDSLQVRWITRMVSEPERFVNRIVDLYAHPNDTSREEIELKDGTVLDRYSSPVVGRDGTSYGRIWAFRDITERKNAEVRLTESNQNFQELVDNITDAFWIRSADMRELRYVSPAFERIWGRPASSLYANPERWSEYTVPEDRERAVAAFALLQRDSPSIDVEYRIVRPDGEIRWIHVRGFQIRDSGGELLRLTGTVSDVTERRRLEARMLQSQKMETVGELAGGVAHEFNSILTTIQGQSELLLRELPAGSPLARNVVEIGTAAGRAASLTRQLLAFGRKQFLQPETLDLNQVIADMSGLLNHLIGSDVNARIIPGPSLKPVRADLGQIEQVIVNMAINARDAMTSGGELTIETANVTVDAETGSRFPDLKPGEYAVLAITDTGAGMSEEARARAFEPFFSTKGVGEGTGLGLSTCYGIVKQSGGEIGVSSEPGRGTTFTVYLPQVDEKRTRSVERVKPPDLPRGTETILQVEDDPALREMSASLLRRLGYKVLTAANGVDALRRKESLAAGTIDLLLTDVVMPLMSGRKLSAGVLATDPRTKLLFTSAYPENAMVHQGVVEEGVSFLRKPFTPSALAHKVREVLDEGSPPGPR